MKDSAVGKTGSTILDSVSDVKKTWSDIRRLGFSDESGNYGYTGDFEDRVCTNIDTNSESTTNKFEAFSKKVECAEAKYNFSNRDTSDDENRKKFALMDIKEGCRQGNLCYGKDEDGIPIKPNQICIEHDACSPPGASLSEVLPDFIDYWKDIKDKFYSLEHQNKKPKKRSKKKDTRSIIKEQIEEKMKQLVVEYNKLPYPDSINNAANNGNAANNADGNGTGASAANNAAGNGNKSKKTAKKLEKKTKKRDILNIQAGNNCETKQQKQFFKIISQKGGSEETLQKDNYNKHIIEKLIAWSDRWTNDTGNRADMKCSSTFPQPWPHKSIKLEKEMIKNVKNKFGKIDGTNKSELPSPFTTGGSGSNTNSANSNTNSANSNTNSSNSNTNSSNNEIDVDEADFDASKKVKLGRRGFLYWDKDIDLNCVPGGDTYGIKYINKNDETVKNIQQCECDTFIPTGMFNHDWEYFRKCYQNFKIMIIIAKEKDLSKKEKLESYCKKYFMNTFYSNFEGDFQPHLDIMLEFAKNHEKLCALNRHLIPGFDNDRLVTLKIKSYIAMIEIQGNVL